MNTKLMTLSLLSISLAGFSSAQNDTSKTAAKDTRKTVTTVKTTTPVDTNSDGKISKEEFSNQAVKSFDKMSSPATHLVKQTEFISFFCGEPVKTAGSDTKYHADCVAVRTRMFEAADTNKDGIVSKEEAKAYAEKQYSDADKNKDGVVTLDEYFTYTLTWDETKPGAKLENKKRTDAKPAEKK